MPLPRMTTRRWMIAVAVVAGLFAAFEAGRRWERAAWGTPRSAVRAYKALFAKPANLPPVARRPANAAKAVR